MSAGRRSNGESSIYRDNAGVWHAWVTVGLKPDGKLDRRHRRGKTRAEVVEKVRALEVARAAGAVTAPGSRWTVASWVDHYISNIKGDALAPRAATTYRSHLRFWIGPHLGHLALEDLRIEHVEKLFTAMRSAGRSAATCERVRATLRAALMVAVRRNLVVRNVASLAQVGARDEPVDRASPLAVEEVRRVVAVVRGRDDAARWSLALLGMRPAECLGLAWDTVDLDGGWLRVEQQLVAVYPYRHGCTDDDHECRACRAYHCPTRFGGRMLTRPKSKESRRKLALPPEVVAQLHEQRARWATRRLAAGLAWDTSWGDLVFTGPLGQPLDSKEDRAIWQEVLAEAGADGHSLYDARHTAATLLAEEGADIQQVKEQLGHAQISTTSRYYLHATDRLAKDSAARLGGALFGG